MNRQIVILGILSLLLQSVAAAQAPAPENGEKGREIAAKKVENVLNDVKLTGVLISSKRHTALVGSQPVSVGDRVGGAEIMAIEPRGIRLLVNSREVSVPIGGALWPVIGNAPVIAYGQHAGQRERRSSREDSDPGPVNRYERHVVASGDTLSAIAERYRRNNMSSDQVMIALFAANPDAFDNNINKLRAGAVLRIPSEPAILAHSRAEAEAEVLRQTDDWQGSPPAVRQPVDVLLAAQPGSIDVEPGNTLSSIAAALNHDDVTPEQAMLALYRANPSAFGNSINVLFAGASLRIPSGKEMRDINPLSASAEVQRQLEAWRHAHMGHPDEDVEADNVMASVSISPN